MKQLHKKVGGYVFFIGVLLMFLGISQVNAAENILGDWVFTMDFGDMGGMGGPGGGMTMTINSTFTKGDDGKITGTWVMNFDAPEGGQGGFGGGPGGGDFQMPTFKIVDVNIDGQKLSFTRKAEGGDAGGMGGMMMEDRKFTGTIKGDTIELTSSSNFGEMTYKGTRKAAVEAANTTLPASGLEGDWVFTMSIPDNGMGMGQMEFTINSKITKDPNGKYAMTWDQQMTPPPGGGDFGGPGGGGFPAPDVKIENIKLDGNTLTFTQKVSFGDMGGMGGGEMVSNFVGTLKGDTIDGKLTSADNGMGMGPMEFTLKGNRKVAATPASVTTAAAPAAGLEGDWVFKMTMADSGMGMGQMEFTINSTITKDAEGKYSMTWNQVMDQPEGGVGGGFGGGNTPTFNVKVEDIKLDGNKLTFVRKVDMGDMGGMGQGGEMTSNFTGTFEGDKIDGTVVSDFGEMKLTGTRKAAAKEVVKQAAAAAPAGLDGDWEFVTTFGDMGMEMRANVSFKKDADGKYTGTWAMIMPEGMGGNAGGFQPPDIKIENIKLDGDKVTFVQKFSMGDMGEMESTYSGTLKGDKIEGTFTSPRGESKSIGTRKKATQTPTTSPAASAASDPLAGDWQFTMSFGGGGPGGGMGGNSEFIINSTFTKKDDGTYSGTWVRQMPEGGQQGFGGGGGFGGGEPPTVTLKDIKLDGNKLTFVQSINFGGQEMSSNFSGTIENGKITGTMTSDMMGEMPITGTKKK